MSDPLSELREEFYDYPYKNGQDKPMGCLGIFHCHHPQQLREVPLYQPMIMLIVTGHKEASLNERRWVLHPGDLFITPPDITFWVNNFPDQQGLPYLGLAFAFSPESVKQFRQLYGTQLLDAWETSPQWQTKAPKEIITALHQWLHWCRRFSVDEPILRHRQVELLLLLARAGLVGNILLGEHPSWRQRVAQLLNMDIARNWKVQDVCQRLAAILTAPPFTGRAKQFPRNSGRSAIGGWTLSVAGNFLANYSSR